MPDYLAIGTLALAWLQSASLSDADRARLDAMAARHQPSIRSVFGSLRPDVQGVALSGGHLVMAVSASDHPAILLFRVDGRGEETWDSAAVSIRSGGRKIRPRVSPGPSGGVDVAWIGLTPAEDGFFLSRLSKDGATSWTARVPDISPSHYDLAPAAGRSILIAWAVPETVHALLIKDGGAIAWRSRWPTLATDRPSGRNPVSCIAFDDRAALLVWYRYTRGENKFRARKILLGDGSPAWVDDIELGDALMFGMGGPKDIPLGLEADGSAVATLVRGISDDFGGNRISVYRVKVTVDGKISQM